MLQGSVGGGADRRREDGGVKGLSVTPQVLPELGVQEVVEQRVEAAAQAGQAQRHRVELEHGLLGATVRDDVLLHHQVEQEVDVVGSEAQQEEGRAAQHHAQGALLLATRMLLPVNLEAGGDRLKPAAARGVIGSGAHVVFVLPLLEGADYADRAVAYADERDDEAEQLGQSHHGGSQRDVQRTHGQVLETASFDVRRQEQPLSTGVSEGRQGHIGRHRGGHVVVRFSRVAPHQDEGRAGQADHHPHYGADQQVIAPPPLASRERVEQEDAPLHADAHL